MTDPFGLGPDELTLREEARSLVAGVTAGEEHRWETDGSFPRERLAGLGDAGLLGLTHPPDLGGRGAGRLEAVIVLEEIAQASFALAEAVQIAVNGPAYVLSVFGTERLRRSYVPPVIAGRSLISIAITEEGAGSALGETATRVTDKGDVVVVDGTKCFVTGGGLASAHLVMARFGGEGMRGLGYVLVPADAEGCRVACTYEKIGGNAVPEAVVELRGCAVPADHVIAPGDPGSTGGFRRAMTTYNAMRLGIAAICCGVATRALSLAVRHLRARQQSGRPLASYQGLRWRTAEIAADVEAARLLTYRAAHMTDEHGFPPARETALAKRAASSVSVAAADHAIQMLGWRGVVRDADYPAERLLREIRGWTIAGGTNEALLNLLAGELLDR